MKFIRHVFLALFIESRPCSKLNHNICTDDDGDNCFSVCLRLFKDNKK